MQDPLPQANFITSGTAIFVAGTLFFVAKKTLSKVRQRRGPVVIATWKFGKIACDKTASLLVEAKKKKLRTSVAEAVEEGIHQVELNDTIRSYVGFGGLPNVNGEMEHDAAIMDGRTLNVGAVMGLKSIACPIKIARCLLDEKDFNILCGNGALEYAIKQGFHKEMTQSERSINDFDKWKCSNQIFSSANEQLSVLALLANDSNETMSSYNHPKSTHSINETKQIESHDTLAVIALGTNGDIVVGTSTSGSPFKLEGRVGDTPLIGSGFYADNTVGAAAASGNGEEIMKFCLSYSVVEYMRDGLCPTKACEKAIARVKSRKLEKGNSIPLINIIAIDKNGNVGASSTICSSRPYESPDATSNPNAFQYCVWENGKSRIYEVSDTK